MPNTTRPNIVIFMSDQEQANVLERGHPCQTPNADRLAREGLRFSQVYATTVIIELAQ